MRTLLSIAHNRNFVKQKDRRTILSLFAEYKTKKIVESLYSETLLMITQHRILVNKKDREILDQFCVLLCLFF